MLVLTDPESVISMGVLLISPARNEMQQPASYGVQSQEESYIAHSEPKGAMVFCLIHARHGSTKHKMKKMIEKVVTRFLNKKLDEGHHELVFGIASYWGSLNGLGKINSFYRASWHTQERLIKEFGYKECPSCRWAVERLDNHPWCCEVFRDDEYLELQSQLEIEYLENIEQWRAEEERYEHYMNGICHECKNYRFACSCRY